MALSNTAGAMKARAKRREQKELAAAATAERNHREREAAKGNDSGTKCELH